MSPDTNGDDNGVDAPPAPNLVLLAERQRLLVKRVTELEKKVLEQETMLNRFIGGFAILVGSGVFFGWLFSAGFLDFMKK